MAEYMFLGLRKSAGIDICDFKDIFGNPDHFYRIAEKDGEIVGLVHGSQSDGLQNLEALYVDKSEHGKGLAQDLMGLVDEWFDDTLPVKLGVASYNDRAIRFYEKYGFRKFGTERNSIKWEGKYYDEDLMVLYLYK